MSTLTTYLNLEKPLMDEKYNINVANKNNDIIDSEFHKLNAAISTKSNQIELDSHIRNDVIHVTNTDKDNWNAAFEHINNGTNPHGTTKSDVGLGNVPNITTNDQTPTFIESETLEKLISGEKLSIAFGKISKAISDLISYLEVANGSVVAPIDPTIATEEGFVADAKLTGNVLKELSAKMETIWNKVFPPIPEEKYFIKSGVLQFGSWSWSDKSDDITTTTGNVYQSGDTYCLSTKVVGSAGRGIIFSSPKIDTDGLSLLKINFAGISAPDYNITLAIKDQDNKSFKSETFQLTTSAAITKSYDISSAESITIALTVSMAGGTNILKISNILLL